MRRQEALRISNDICGLVLVSLLGTAILTEAADQEAKISDPSKGQVDENGSLRHYQVLVRLKTRRPFSMSEIKLELRDESDRVLKVRLTDRLEPAVFTCSLVSKSSLKAFKYGRIRVFNRWKNVTPYLVAQQVNYNGESAVDLNFVSGSDPEMSARLCITSGVLDFPDSWFGLNQCR